MILQKTIKNPVSISGIGLHSGNTVSMKLIPAKPNKGIVFRRVDLFPAVEIKVSANKVSGTQLCTIIEENGVKIATIEHIMSALAGIGIDNIIIELDSSEIPIVDGSSSPFVFLIQSVGTVSQDAPKKIICVKQEVMVRDGDKWAKLSPFKNGFRIDFKIDFDHPSIKKTNSNASLNLSQQSYIQEVSRARTFGFLHDIEYLRQNNLALGGSLDNAVVLDDFRVLNEKGLRYEDEFVRHKILDAIGDLYLEGYAFMAHYVGYKSGHALNNNLFRALLADKSSYELCSIDDSSGFMASPNSLLNPVKVVY